MDSKKTESGKRKNRVEEAENHRSPALQRVVQEVWQR